jgi:hypothetical protein
MYRNRTRDYTGTPTDIKSYNLLERYNLPDLDPQSIKQIRASYSYDKLKALFILGFDFTKSRCQGTEYVLNTKAETSNTREISVNWAQYDMASIKQGRLVKYTKHGVEYLTSNINPIYISKKKGTNLIMEHELCRFTNRRKGERYTGIVEDYVSRNINRFSNKGVALSQYKYSKAVCFDIDSHDIDHIEKSKEIADLTLECLFYKLDNHEEAFIERSVWGGYHVIFLTNDIVTDEMTSRFCKEFFLEFGLKIEARTTNKVFRLPCHFTYNAGYTKYMNGKRMFIPYDPVMQHEIYKDRVFDHDTRGVRMDISLLHYKHDHIILKDKIDDRKYKIIYEEVKIPVYTRRYKNEGNSFNPDNFKIEEGKRAKNMFVLAMYYRRQGYNKEVYIDKLNENYTNSKDWGSWSYSRKMKEIDYAWENVLKPEYNEYKGYSFIFHDSNEFISSSDKVPDKLKKLINHPLVLNALCDFKENQYEANKDKLRREIPIMLIEAIGKLLNDFDSPRRMRYDGEDLTPAIRRRISAGIYFPQEFIYKMKSHYSLKCDTYNTFFKMVKDTGLFKQYKHNRAGYKIKAHQYDYGFCRQWYIGNSPYTRDSEYVINLIYKHLTGIAKSYYSHRYSAHSIMNNNNKTNSSDMLGVYTNEVPVFSISFDIGSP